MTIRKILLGFALALPVIGLLGAVTLSATQEKTSKKFTIPIVGYDPRDLLRGQYLQFRYVLPDSIPDNIAFEAGHEKGVCLDDTGGTLKATPVTDTKCPYYVRLWDAREGTLASVAINTTPSLSGRFFLPEGNAKAVQNLLRDKAHKLDVIAYTKGGTLVPTMLLIDGKPWTDADLTVTDDKLEMIEQRHIEVPVIATHTCNTGNQLVIGYDWANYKADKADEPVKDRADRGLFTVWQGTTKERPQKIARLEKLLADGKHKVTAILNGLPSAENNVQPYELRIDGKPWNEALDAIDPIGKNKP